MKLIVERENGNAKLIRAEYTPAEALVINHAMRRYTYMLDINNENISLMEKMLETQPEFIDKAEAVDEKGGLLASVKE